MSFVLLCSWSSILLFAGMVRYKYRCTAPPYAVFFLFALAGINATLPAALFNNLIGMQTSLGFFSADPHLRLLAFLLGPGMGEECFKFANGLLILLILSVMHEDIGPSGRFLGFVIVGLTFATAENIWVYYWVDFWPMVTRTVLAVPLHASMGMIHGAAANRAYKRGSMWPLLVGYLVTLGLHFLYDTADIVFGGVNPHWVLGPMVALLMLGGLRYWRDTPEHAPIALPEPATEAMP